MVKINILVVFLFFIVNLSNVQGQEFTSSKNTYLLDIKKELTSVWPNNRTINLVFHGHSVPAGYWHNHEVHTLQSYPYLVLKKLKKKYPFAVINIIITAIGGENSIEGEKRFENDVLVHKPDVLFIDYSLNDRGVGLEKAGKAWRKMIESALNKGVKIILMTPSPDKRVQMLIPKSQLALHANQVKMLSREYKIGLVNSFKIFQNYLREGANLESFMSHINHPSKKGHELIANQIIEWF